MRPITVGAPSGTIVEPGAARRLRRARRDRLPRVRHHHGALAQVVPDRVIAGCEGGPTLFSIGGWRDGEPFVLTEVMVGTWGARAGQDGAGGHFQPCREPVQPADRTDRGRTAACSGAVRSSCRIPAGLGNSAAGSRSFANGGCWPRRRSSPCAPTAAHPSALRRSPAAKPGQPSMNLFSSSGQTKDSAHRCLWRDDDAPRRFVPSRRRRRRRLSAIRSSATRRWCWRMCLTRKFRSPRHGGTMAWQSIRSR